MNSPRLRGESSSPLRSSASSAVKSLSLPLRLCPAAAGVKSLVFVLLLLALSALRPASASAAAATGTCPATCANSTPGDSCWEWTGATDTDWGTTTNWDEGSVPGNNSDTCIPGTGITNWPSVDSSANRLMRDFTLESGGQMTLNMVNRNFTVRGDAQLYGCITHTSGDVLFNLAGQANGVFYGAGTATAGCELVDLNITSAAVETLTMQSGAKLKVSGTFILNGSVDLVMGTYGPPNQAELNVDGSTLLTWTGTFTEGDGIVMFRGNTNPPLDRFYDLVIAGNSSLQGAMDSANGRDVANALTINSGASLGTATFALDVGGNLTNNGTFTASAGVLVRLIGTGGHTVSGTFSFTDVTFGDGTNTETTTLASGSSITVTEDLAIAANHTLTNNGTLTYSGLSWTNTGTFTGGGGSTGTVVWKKNANLPTDSGSNNLGYYNLTLDLPVSSDSAAPGTTANPLVIANNLTITKGNLIGSSATINVAGTWTNNVAGIDCLNANTDGFMEGTSTVVFTGAASLIASDECFNNLNIGVADGDAEATSVSFGKTIELTSGGTFSIVGDTTGSTYNAGSSAFLKLTNASFGSNAVFTKQTSTVVWRGTAIPTAFNNFYNLTLETGAASVAAATTVSNNLTISSSLNTAGNALNIGGNFTVNGTLTDSTCPGTCTVLTLNETGSKTVSGGTNPIPVSQLTVAKTGGGTVTLNQNVTTDAAAGDVTLTSGTFDLGNSTLTANGNVNVNGGTLKLLGTPTLAVGSSKTLTIGASGTLSAGGTGPTITRTGAGTYTFAVNGTVDIAALNVSFADNSGMKITVANGASSNITTLDNLSFSETPEVCASDAFATSCGGTTPGTNFSCALWIDVQAGTLNHTGTSSFNGHSFASTVRDANLCFTSAGTTSNSRIDMDNFSGARGGDGFDFDEGGTDADTVWNQTCMWTGATDTNWHTAGNWSSCSGNVPGGTDSAEVPATCSPNCPVINTGGNASIKNLTLKCAGASGATLNLGVSKTLTINNTFVIETGCAGPANFVPGSGSTVVFNATPNTSVPDSAAPDYYNLTIEPTGAAAGATGNLDIDGNLTVSASATLNGGTATIRVKGNWAVAGTFNAQSSTVVLNGTSQQTVTASDFFNLTVSNAAGALIEGNINVDGNLVVTSGATLDGNINASYNINLAGNFCLGQLTTESATFTTGLSTVILDGGGAATQWLVVNNSANMPFNHLNASSVLAAKIGQDCSSPAESAETLDINGNLTIGASATLDATNDTLNLASNITRNGTFTSTGSTVVFDGTGAQAIGTATTFNALTINKSAGTLTASGNVTANGAATLTAGTFDLSSGAHTFNGAVSVNGGTFNLNTSGLTLAGNVTVASTAVFQMAGNDTARAVLTFDNAGGIRTMTVNGTFQTTQSGSAPLKPKITTSVTTTNFTSFTVSATSTVDVTGLEFTRSDATGFTISNGSTITNFTKAAFGPLGNGSTDYATQGINLLDANGTGITCTDCSFDASMQRNVNANSINGTLTLTFVSFSGDRSGSTFEINDANNKISWVRTRTWSGAVDTLWTRANNYNPTGQGNPGSDDRIIIPSATNEPAIGAASTTIRILDVNEGGVLHFNGDGIDDLTVNNDVTIAWNGTTGGAINMVAAGNELFVGGTWTDNVPLANIDCSAPGLAGLCQTAGASRRVYFTDASSVIGNEPNFRAVTIRDGATTTLGTAAAVVFVSGAGSGAMTIGEGASGALSGNDATLTIDDVGITVSAGGAWTPQNSTVKLRGTYTATCTLNASVTSFNHLEITAGSTTTVQLCGPVTVNGNLTVKAGATLDMGGFTLLVKGTTTIENTGTLTVGASTLTLEGNLSNAGTLGAGSGTISMTPPATTTQTVGGAGTFTLNNLTVGPNSTTSPSVNLTAAGSLTINGTLSIGSTTFTHTGATVAGTGTLNLGTGTYEERGTFGAGVIITASSGLFLYNDTAQDVRCQTYYNVKFGDPSIATTYSLNNCDLTVTNNLEIAANGALDVSLSSCGGATRSCNITVGGNWTRTGTFTERTGTVTFNGGGSQSTATAANFYNLTINNSGAGSFTGSGGDLSVSGNLTVTAGTFNADNVTIARAHTVVGTVQVNGGTFDLKVSSLTAGAVNIGTTGTAATMVISGNGAAATDMDVAGALTIGVDGTLDAGASATTALAIGGNWSDSGAFNVGNTIVTLDGGNADVSAAGTGDFYNLTVNSSLTKTALSNLGISNNLRVDGGTLDAVATTVIVTKDVLNTDGATGTVKIGAGTLDANQHVTPGSGSTLGIEWTGAGTLKVAGTLTATGLQLRDAGAPLNTGTVTFDGTSAQTIPVLTDGTWNQYNNVNTSGSAKTAGGGLTLAGTLNVQGSSFSAGTGYTHSIGSVDVDSGATFSLSTSTVNVTAGDTTCAAAAASLCNDGTITLTTGSLNQQSTSGGVDNNATIRYDGAATIDVNGALDGTGGTLDFNGQAGALRYGGTTAPVWGTLNESAGTIRFDNAAGGTVTIPSETYYHLETGNVSTTFEMGGALTVSGHLTIDTTADATDSTLSVSGTNYALTVQGNWTNNGVFTAGTGTVTLNGAAAQTVAAGTGQVLNFYNLVISNTSAPGAALSSNLNTVANDLTVSASSLLELGVGLTHIVGRNTVVNGTLRTDSSTLRHTNTTTCTININAGGRWDFEEGGVLDLANGCAITVATGAPQGELRSTYTSTKPIIRSITPGTDRFALTINGRIWLNGMQVNSPDACGLYVAAGASVTDIDKVDWSNPSGGTCGGACAGGTGARYLTICTVDTSYSFTNHTFNGLNAGAGPAPANVVTIADGSAPQLDVQMVDGSCPGAWNNGGACANACECHESEGTTDNIDWTSVNQWQSNGSAPCDGNENSWNTAINWSKGTVPVAADPIVIPVVANGCYPTIDVATAYAKDLTINAAGATTPKIILGSNTLEIGGDLTINGEFDSGTGTVNLNGASDQAISGASGLTKDLYNLTVTSSSGNKGLLSNLDVLNNFTINPSAVFDVGSYTVTVGGTFDLNSAVTIGSGLVDAGGAFDATGGTITFTGTCPGSGGRLQLGGPVTSLGTFTSGNGTVEYDAGSADNIETVTYCNVEIDSGGTVKMTAGGALDVDGNLTITTGDFDWGTGLTHTLDGNVVHNGGTITPSTSTFTLAGGNGQSLSGSAGTTTLNNITINKSAGTVTIAKSGITLNGNLSMVDGDLDTGAFTLNVTGNCDLDSDDVANTPKNKVTIPTGGVLNCDGTFDGAQAELTFGASGTGRLQVAGAFNGTASLTFTAGNGTVEFDGSTSANLPASTYYNLEIDKGAGTATTIASVTVSNNLTVTTGTLNLDDGANTWTLTVNGNVTSAGAITADNAATALTVVGTYTNNTGGALNVGPGTVTVAGLFDNNATVNVQTGILDLNGAFDGTGGTLDGGTSGTVEYGSATTAIWGTLTENTGTIRYDNTVATQTIPAETYYHLQIAKTAQTASAGGALDVNGNFTLTSGTFNPGTSLTHTVAGNWNDSGGTFQPTTGTIKIDGTASSITTAATNNFFNLETAAGNGNTTTAATNLDVNGTLTGTSGTLALGALTHDTAGAVSVTGTLNMATSTLTSNNGLTVNSGGTLKMDGAASARPTLKLANAKTLTNSGTWVTTFTSASWKPQVTATVEDGSVRYAITGAGTYNINGLLLKYPDSNGLTVSAGATVTKIDSVDFKNAPASGKFLRVLSTGTYTLSTDTFDATFGSCCNVSTVAGTTITMTNFGGAGAGEAYDDDSAGSINWTSNAQWTGATSCDWNLAGNWDTGVVPNNFTNVTVPDIAATACGGGGPFDPDILTANADTNALTINNGGILDHAAAYTLTVGGNFTLNTGGTYTLNNATARLKVGGTYSRSGTFTQTAGTVEFTGSAVIGTETFSVPVVVSGSSVTLASAATVTVANVVAEANDLNVQSGGSLNLGSNGTLKMGGTAKANIAGTFRATSTTAKVTSSTANCPVVGDRFDFEIASTGTINVTGLTFECADAQGLDVKSGATITDLSNVAFANAQSSGCPCAHLTVTRSGDYNKSIPGLSFDAANATGTPYNVKLDNDTGAAASKLQVGKATTPGAGWSEAYENEVDGCDGVGADSCINWLANSSADIQGKTRGFPAPVLSGSSVVGMIIADDRGVGNDWIVALDTNGAKTSELQVSGDITVAPFVFNNAAYGGAQIWIGTSNGNLYRYLWSGGTLTLATGFPVSVGNSITTGIGSGKPTTGGGWTSPSCAADDPSGDGGTFFFGGTDGSDDPAVFGYNLCGQCMYKIANAGGTWTTTSTPTMLNDNVWIGTDSEGVLRISNSGGNSMQRGDGCGAGIDPNNPTVDGIVSLSIRTPGAGAGAANNSAVSGQMVPHFPGPGQPMSEFLYATSDDAPNDSRLYAINITNGGNATGFPIDFGTSGVDGSVMAIWDKIYFGANNGTLYGYDFATGAVISGGGRSLDATNPSSPQSSGGADNAIKSTPLIYNNVAYFGSNNGKLYAVDVNAGGATLGQVCKSWNLGTDPISSKPSALDLGGVKITVGTDGGGWYAFDAVTCP